MGVFSNLKNYIFMYNSFPTTSDLSILQHTSEFGLDCGVY